MRIPKSLLIQPGRNTAYGVFAVAVSFVAFAYSTIFGQLLILAYYAVWLPLILVDHRFTLFRVLQSPIVLVFALFACVSTFWSVAPAETARASVQYLSHVICAAVAARVIDGRTLTLGAMVGVVLILLYSLMRPNYNYDVLDGSYAFVGAFGSKNMLGFFASLGVFFSTFFCLFYGRTMPSRAASALIILFSASMLMRSQSATSIIATPLSLAALMVFAAMQKFSASYRKAFLAGGSALFVMSVFVVLNAGVLDAVLGAFGKDSTLTGRTYLWSEGMKAAEMAPILGHGYQAYWVQGFAEAERLWAEFYIASRGGFHFHNTYVETLVELGLVGTAILVLLLLTTVAILVRKLLSDNYWREPLLQFGILMLILIRSFFEVEIIQTYMAASFLFFYCAARAREPVPRAAVRRFQPQPLGLSETRQHA